MRVSDSMLYYLSKTGLGGARGRLAAAQQRASTGIAVSKPSDDPVAFVQAQKEATRGNRAERHERTINVAAMALQVADAALSQVTEALQSIQEKAISAATDTLSADERVGLSEEVAALRDQVLALANSKAQGRYIFGGYIDNQQPFDAAGQYHGHSEVRQVEVANGVKVSIGISGNRVFGADGGQDVFAAIDDLQNALESNDVDAVRASLDSIDKAHAQVIASRSQLGAYMDAFEVAGAVAQQLQTQAAANRSQLVEVDAFDAMSDLSRAQQALEAAVVIASQLPMPGLVSMAY
jgi:flagellar hook-associated protein 3 FlgL